MIFVMTLLAILEWTEGSNIDSEFDGKITHVIVLLRIFVVLTDLCSSKILLVGDMENFNM